MVAHKRKMMLRERYRVRAVAMLGTRKGAFSAPGSRREIERPMLEGLYESGRDIQHWWREAGAESVPFCASAVTLGWAEGPEFLTLYCAGRDTASESL